MPRKLLWKAKLNSSILAFAWEDTETKEVFIGEPCRGRAHQFQDEVLATELEIPRATPIMEVNFCLVYERLQRWWPEKWDTVPEELKKRLRAKYCALVL